MTRINIIFICLFVFCSEPILFNVLETYYLRELENNSNHVIPSGRYTKFTSKVDSLMAFGDTAKLRKAYYSVEYKGRSNDKQDYPYKYEIVGSSWDYYYIYSSKGWYMSASSSPEYIYAKSPISSEEEIKSCITKSLKLFRDSVSSPSDGSYDEVYDRYNKASKLAHSNILYGYRDGHCLCEYLNNVRFDKYCVVVVEDGIRQISPYLDSDYCKLKDNIYSITLYTILVVFVFLYFHKKYMTREVKNKCSI